MVFAERYANLHFLNDIPVYVQHQHKDLQILNSSHMLTLIDFELHLGPS